MVRACNNLRIMIDVAHLNERGFWDVAALTDVPLVASHSNAYALCPSTRNLTDPQLDAIAASAGMVGLSFAVNFLREDAARDASTPLEVMVNKAFTSASFLTPIQDLAEMTQPGQPLYGLETTNNGRVVNFAGGIPLTRGDGRVVGAIGVSGGTVDQDQEVAEADAAAL